MATHFRRKAGVYQPEVDFLQKNASKEDPYFLISDSDYRWIPNEFDKSSLPCASFLLPMHPELYDAFCLFEKKAKLVEVNVHKKDYVIAQSKDSLFCYKVDID